MFFDIEITDDLFTIPPTAPPITRQHGFSNLLALTSVLPLNIEVNLDENIFRSIPPNFDNLINNNLPQIKRYNSETKELIKIPNIKRINTY